MKTEDERRSASRVQTGPAARRAFSGAALPIAGAALAISLFALLTGRTHTSPQPGPALAMAACSGSVAESPDEEFWRIPLTKCDGAIDKIDVKSGFVTKWSICGGAKSFEVSLDPRAVVVSSDHVHCSRTPSEVSVMFVGSSKE
jgi:hypothetical protein